VSARKDYPYPEDEFDVAGASGGPEGVHRGERSTGRKALPWIIVLLIVPLISFGVVFYLSQNDSDIGGLFTDDEPRPTEPADDGTDPDEGEGEEGQTEGEGENADEGENGEGEQEEPEPEETPAAPVDREAQVEVLNATSISGLAAVGAERLEVDGFVSVTADNYRGGQTRADSVVKYTGEDMKPTADLVAQILGIDDVVEDPEPRERVIVEIWQGLN